MKKIFFILSLVAASLTGAMAQQVPLYSQYWDAPMIYNPARTGADARYNVNFIYRRQMAGFKDGPETKAGTFDMPLMNNRAGIGAYYFNDATSIFRRNGGYISYAYHIPLNKAGDHHLSIGLAAGVQSVKINLSEVNVIDPTDPLIANGRSRNTFFDANFGINYNWRQLNIGISVPQILGVDLHYLNDNGNRGYSPRRQYMATASYDVQLLKKGKDNMPMLTITPMVLFRTTEALDWQIEGGVKLMYKDWIWIDAMYRYNYGVTVGGGVKIHDMVKVGYAYDRSVSDLKSYTTGNHEIIIGLTFPSKKKNEIPDSTLDKINKNDSLLKALTTKVDTMSMKQDSMANKLDSLNRHVDTLQKQVDLLNGSMDSLNSIFGDSTDGSLRNTLKKLDKGKLDDLMKKMEELDEKYKDVEKNGGKNAKDKNGKTKKGSKELTEEERVAKEKADKEKAEKAAKKKKTKTDTENEAEMQEHKTRVVDEKDLEFKHGTPMGDYFMVVGSFRIEANSGKLETQLNKENFKPGVVYDKKRKWYYVYLSKPESKEAGLDELYKLREENPRFHDAWIHIMSKAVK